MQITFHLKAKNSSGQQGLHINPDNPEGKVNITLTGEYKGKDIQVDFDPVDKETLKNNLRSLVEVL